MGCGKSKHDIATGNILTKNKRPSFSPVASSKSKKAPETDTKNVADKEIEVKGGEKLVDKTSDVNGKEEAAEEKEKVEGALETHQIPDKETEHKVDAENAKPVVEKISVELQVTQAVKENAAEAAIVIVEEKKPLLQEIKVEKEKAEETIVVQEEKLVVIKEDKGTVKVEEEKAIKEDDNFAAKVVEAAQLAEEKAVKDNLVVKEVEVAKSVMVDEAKPPTENGQEENPAIMKETNADSAAANDLNISSEKK